MKVLPNNMDVVILCGGKGERLRSVVSHVPKVLASVRGRPMLDVLINKLYDSGLRRFILCTGYLKELVKTHTENLISKNIFPNATFVLSEETEPLGTGGALKNAAKHIWDENFLVVNGDTIWSVDFSDLYKKHMAMNAALTFALVDEKDRSDYGSIVLDEHGLANSFIEKGQHVPNSFVSAGAYLMNRSIFSHMPDQKSFSLEFDVFPGLAANKLCAGCVLDASFLDIGTPARYEKAQKENFA